MMWIKIYWEMNVHWKGRERERERIRKRIRSRDGDISIRVKKFRAKN